MTGLARLAGGRASPVVLSTAVPCVPVRTTSLVLGTKSWLLEDRCGPCSPCAVGKPSPILAPFASDSATNLHSDNRNSAPEDCYDGESA